MTNKNKPESLTEHLKILNHAKYQSHTDNVFSSCLNSNNLQQPERDFNEKARESFHAKFLTDDEISHLKMRVRKRLTLGLRLKHETRIREIKMQRIRKSTCIFESRIKEIFTVTFSNMSTFCRIVRILRI